MKCNFHCFSIKVVEFLLTDFDFSVQSLWDSKVFSSLLNSYLTVYIGSQSSLLLRLVFVLFVAILPTWTPNPPTFLFKKTVKRCYCYLAWLYLYGTSQRPILTSLLSQNTILRFILICPSTKWQGRRKTAMICVLLGF